MRIYYNEFDKKKCSAMAQLMADGHIPRGEIDDRSIRDVQPGDLAGYDRCHFFAGIGLWEYALNLAGWPEDKPVWTGSCPCQPFSTAGRQAGKADDRHLWPEWFRLISECSPSTIFGEQVASAIAQGWLDDVYQGLEAQGYACGAAVLPASAIGAPHRRERLFFVADSDSHGCSEARESITKTWFDGFFGNSGTLGNAERTGLEGHARHDEGINEQGWHEAQQKRPAWATGVWVDCPDGKARLVEPGIPLLANGYPERVGVIHCAGDAIVPQVAAEFIRAAM